MEIKPPAVPQLPKTPGSRKIEPSLPATYQGLEAKSWFLEKDMPPVIKDNQVKFYVDGISAFQDIADTLHDGHNIDGSSLILLLGWFCESNFQLSKGYASTLNDLFTECNKRGAKIRVMLWRNSTPGLDNAPVVNFVNSLSYGAAILDARTAIVGSHHQKLLVVYGKGGVSGFCGGMDIVKDRIDQTWGPAPLHDVHCRIDGPAAEELAKVFIERWNDHPEHAKKFNETLAAPRTPRISSPDGYLIQVGRTYPRIAMYINIGLTFVIDRLREYPSIKNNPKFTRPTGDMNDGQGHFKPYSFLPTGQGEKTAWRMIQNGIAQAKKFIYLEDQYLVSRDASSELAKKLADPNFRLIILIPHSNGWQRRLEFISDLQAADPTSTRWIVCYLKPPNGRGTYVHSKTWIFDDEFFITGSANSTRRSYTNDSEVVVGIVGRPSGSVVRNKSVQALPPLAQSLRCQLWAKHLQVSPEAVTDALKSTHLWFKPPSTAKIAKYDPREAKDPPTGYDQFKNLAWDYIFDPDGA